MAPCSRRSKIARMHAPAPLHLSIHLIRGVQSKQFPPNVGYDYCIGQRIVFEFTDPGALDRAVGAGEFGGGLETNLRVIDDIAQDQSILKPAFRVVPGGHLNRQRDQIAAFALSDHVHDNGVNCGRRDERVEFRH